MQNPIKSETDAFRIAAILGILAALSILLGVITSAEWGIILAAAGIAAGLTFELSGGGEAGAALEQAAHSPHRRGATHGERHIVVVASEPLGGEELRRELADAGGADFRIDILAPVFSSHAHFWASDTDAERKKAQERLESSLAWAREQGLAAEGEVGDPDPLVALEDELRAFGADEVIIAVQSGERANWLADRMLTQMSSALDVPVRRVVTYSGEESSSYDTGRDKV